MTLFHAYLSCLFSTVCCFLPSRSQTDSKHAFDRFLTSETQQETHSPERSAPDDSVKPHVIRHETSTLTVNKQQHPLMLKSSFLCTEPTRLAASLPPSANCICKTRAVVGVHYGVNARRRCRDELQHMLHFCQII